MSDVECRGSEVVSAEPSGRKSSESDTYDWHEKLFDLFERAPHLDVGAICGVLDGDEHVQLVVEMLPVGFASVLLLLRSSSGARLAGECEWGRESRRRQLTFFLSRIEPRPLIMILQPVSCSNCFAVIPRGPSRRPTKLYSGCASTGT